ncbi:MAG: anti-sigma F factor antagonist [Bacillota bacterium]|nr:anti-sigma F factor antagonist [Bacillota bacterium]
MEPTIKKANEILLIQMKGDIDLVNAEKFRLMVDKQIEKKIFKHLIINLQEVDFIDSSGLGAILGRYKKVIEQGGQVVIISPKPQVLRILDLSGFTKIMKVFPSEEQALGQLA